MYNTGPNLIMTMDVRSKIGKDTSVHAIALKIMKEHNKPMTVKEITKLVLEKKTISSKVPYQTISSILQRSQYVKRVSRSTFQLIDN